MIHDIKRALKDKGMKQEELAQILGISYSSMRRILCGAATLTTQLARHISLVLGLKENNKAPEKTDELAMIKEDMFANGWTISKLAKELSINPVNLGQILSGHRPLTEQLKKHIEFVLGVRKAQMLIFTVALPDASCQAMFPGWESLSDAEKRESCNAVIREALKELFSLGKGALSVEELQKLKEILGEA